MSEADAISWNEAFETRKGLTVEDGTARYQGRLKDLLAEEGSVHAEGFALKDLEAVCRNLLGLRDRLAALPSRVN
ncbi:hypothetical protein JYU29_15300 [Tianweitania sp. BSSL-BM11]|uniref:Uncharacterized protein n=1 Tax=Tianweitania aestuarii TaxID=2814886 RepID=A0ABS5RYD4_9HYPH|nr:hypothetical protein [Tianweitania aestuarii]MBS9722058.1 hypothetical protein [Tianweitania aestuarii]